jgi:catechol 2,3-dioxygenase-like lactoylglutathione lyase family enzyme
MIRTRGLTHIALTVADLERSVAFYTQLLGSVEVYRDEAFVQLQTPGTWDVIVLERGRKGVGKSGGIAHFGFRLIDPADIDRAAEAVATAGGVVTEKGEFVPGEPYLFATDPDGYEIELWYELPTPADPASIPS